jgi:hypothetical protein
MTKQLIILFIGMCLISAYIVLFSGVYHAL